MPKAKTVVTSIRMPVSIRDEIQGVAESETRNLSEQCLHLIKLGLELHYAIKAAGNQEHKRGRKPKQKGVTI